MTQLAVIEIFWDERSGGIESVTIYGDGAFDDREHALGFILGKATTRADEKKAFVDPPFTEKDLAVRDNDDSLVGELTYPKDVIRYELDYDDGVSDHWLIVPVADIVKWVKRYTGVMDWDGDFEKPRFANPYDPTKE